MLEIVISVLIIIAGVAWLLMRRTKPGPGTKPVDYICTQCGEKNCHCERRS